MESVVDVAAPVDIPGAFARPEAYPHPVGEVQVIETHISWVFLTDLFAYKVKRPVNLGFVDFTHLENRQRSCSLEVQLNRRYARDLYLGVLPIYLGSSGPSLAAPGPVIEYAVVMWRFDTKDLAAHRSERGLLPPHDLEAFAVSLAQFHRTAATAPESCAYGTPFEVLKESTDSLRLLQRKADLSDSRDFQTVAEWIEETTPDLLEIFDGRRRHGHVRECHGDLHLENIVHWNQRLIPFDGIEFNEVFRWIDTVSDAAFLAMDLSSRGAWAGARRFINAYFEASGDYRGLGTLRWYWVQRALIRAKIAAINAHESDGTVKKAQWDTMERYLRNAAEVTKERTPSLWITFGPSAGGKSTRALDCVERYGAFRLRSDVERRRLLGMDVDGNQEAPPGEGIYSPENSANTYEWLRTLAEITLRAGESAIVDATFLERGARDSFRNLANETGSQFRILDCSQHTREALHRRLENRRKNECDPSEATHEVLDAQIVALEPLGEDEKCFVRE